MSYLTDRKRAERKGASGTGTEHFWYMTVSSVVLAFLIPAFVIMFGRALGGTREEVLDRFSQPFLAILTGLVLFVSMQHYWRGAETLISDYTRGGWRKGLIMAAIGLAYTLLAVGLFALGKIAL